MRVVDPGEVLVPTHEIAKASGLSTELAIDKFGRQLGWAFQLGDRGQWYVYESTFAQRMPQLHLRWREMRDAGAFRVPARARWGNQNSHQAKVARKARQAKDG